jgi:hypothetical protein
MSLGLTIHPDLVTNPMVHHLVTWVPFLEIALSRQIGLHGL